MATEIADEPRDPDLENLLALHRSHMVAAMNTWLPGQVVDYDATKQTATVQALATDSHYNEDGERVSQNYPPTHDVPVMFIGPARGRITFPVAQGDLCVLLYCSRSLSRLFTLGAGGGPVDPGDDRRGDLSDPIAIVGLHLQTGPTDAPTDAIVLHADGIQIKLGSSAASKAPAFNDDLATLVSTLAGVTPGPGSGDAAIAALQAYVTGHPSFPAGSAKVEME
jgi:Phage protein Gp138 N-terminal domain